MAKKAFLTDGVGASVQNLFFSKFPGEDRQGQHMPGLEEQMLKPAQEAGDVSSSARQEKRPRGHYKAEADRKGRKVSMMMPQALFDEVQHAAGERGMTASAYMVEAIQKAIKASKKKR